MEKGLCFVLVISLVLLSSGCLQEDQNWETESITFSPPEGFEQSLTGVPSDLGGQEDIRAMYTYDSGNQSTNYIVLKVVDSNSNSSLTSNQTTNDIQNRTSSDDYVDINSQNMSVYEASGKSWIKIQQDITLLQPKLLRQNFSRNIHVTKSDGSLYVYEYSELESVEPLENATEVHRAAKPAQNSYYEEFKQAAHEAHSD